ncbi:substrate-binding domain-containing protein [Paenibacillus silviterrae]|uniref:substrate-binding domain-containing protein n=1 Tax=Paenibacillus silviterrae TaxID=3242194 RepID=UPI0025427C3C|nr:substrate-binding domain-containing protein [Paenibacillus chinjuensis]
MSNRSWNIVVITLSILFATGLAMFLFSTLRIHQWVGSLTQEQPAGDRPKRIMLISQELDNPFWRTVEQGAREASAAHAYELDYAGPFRINPLEQRKLLEKAIAAKVDALLVQGLGDPAYRELIDQAVAQGIPVITVDTDERDSKRLAYVGSNHTEAGERMGRLVAEASGGRGRIGVLVGELQASNQRERLDGFRSVIGRYPELSIVEVRSSHISRLQASRQAEELLLKHPGVGYMIGFSTLDAVGILDAVKRVQANGMTIFGFDDLRETMEGIQACTISATLVQQPREMGQTAVSLLHDFFAGRVPGPMHYTDITVAGGICR